MFMVVRETLVRFSTYVNLVCVLLMLTSMTSERRKVHEVVYKI